MINYDPFWDKVELLLKMNGADASTTFTDLSNNALIVTPAGNAQVDTSNKKFGTGSLLLDGNADYLELPSNTAFDIDNTDDITIEMFVYSAATPSGTQSLFQRRDDQAYASGYELYYRDTGLLNWYVWNNTTTTVLNISSSEALPLNQWNHVAVVRTSGDTWTIYINGVNKGSGVQNGTPAGGQTVRIGSEYNNQSYFNGWIDEVRFTRAARYTADFTPSTETFYDSTIIGDPNFGNVSLHLRAEGTEGGTNVVDTSSLARNVLSSPGVITTDAKSKFGERSARLPGSDNYIQVDSYYPPVDQAQPITFEAWINVDSTSHINTIFNTRGSDAAGWLLLTSATGALGFYGYDNGITRIALVSADSLISANQWHHVALVRLDDAVTWKIFLDGVEVATGTQSGDITYTGATTDLRLGNNIQATDRYLIGYIDEVRVTENVARYTETFTVPTEPFVAAQAMESALFDPNWNNVDMLLHMDGTSGSTTFTDSSQSNWPITGNNGAALSDANPKFGPTSLLLDGTDDFMQVDGSGISIGTSDFTFEGWFYANSLATEARLLDFRPYLVGGNYIVLNVSSTQMKLHVDGWRIEADHGIGTNEWVHWALERHNGTTTIYVNGVGIGSWADATNYLTTTNRPTIGGGSYNAPEALFDGYMDEIRLTLDVARYTTNFIVPTSAFAETATDPGLVLPSVDEGYDDDYDTVLLLIHGDGADASTVIKDSSHENDILTVSGNTQISTTQSKFGGSSLYFDGTGSISQANSLKYRLDGSENITLEWQLYIESYPGAGTSWNVFSTSVYAGGYAARINETGNITWNGTTGSNTSAFSGSSNIAIPLNQWVHVALVRTGGNTWNLYIDGALDSTIVEGGKAHSRGTLGIGSSFVGYIDEVRFSRMARYTGAFAPLTLAFPNQGRTRQGDEYYDNVELLLHMDGTPGSTTFTDSSSKERPITRIGSVISSAESKFGGTSGYFDGTDYLSIQDFAGLGFGTGDFTLEGFAKLNTVQKTSLIDFTPSFVNGAYPAFHIDGTNVYYYTNGSNRIIAEHNADLTEWFHWAVSRVSGTTMVFVNGVLAGSWADSTNYATPYSGVIGTRGYTRGQLSLVGYMDEVRITKGVGRYTSRFIPTVVPNPDFAMEFSGVHVDPNQLDEHIADVKILLRMEGEDGEMVFRDSSLAYQTIINRHSVQTQHAVNKFGNTSAYFPGSSYLNTGYSVDFSHDQAFTFEAWINVNDASVVQTIFNTRTEYTAQGLTFFTSATGQFSIRGYDSGATNLALDSADSVISQNTWHHVAAVRLDDTNWKLFVDGSEVAAGAQTGSISVGSDLLLGYNRTASYYFDGYMDEVRVTENVARYTESFSAPVEPFPEYGVITINPAPGLKYVDPANVALLIENSNADFMSEFVDSSTNNYSILNYSNPMTIGNALSQYNTNSSIYLDSSDFNVNAKATDRVIEFWFKPRGVRTDNQFLAGKRLNSGTGYQFYLTTGGNVYFTSHYDNQAVATLGSANTIREGEWNHVAVEWHNSIQTIYLNGVVGGSRSDDIDNFTGNSYALHIGHRNHLTGSDGFVGEIDNFRFVTTSIYQGEFVPEDIATEVIKQSIDVILKPDTYVGPEVRVIKQSMDIIIRPIMDSSRRITYAYIVRGRR